MDHANIFHMNVEMGNDKHSERAVFKVQHSQHAAVYITEYTVGGIDHNLACANYVVMTHKFWILNEQCQAFAPGFQLVPNHVPHAWLPNTSPGGNCNQMSDLHYHSRVGQLRFLYSILSQPGSMMLMTGQIPKSHEEQMRRGTDSEDKLLSDELSSEIVRPVNSRYMSLNIQQTYSS